ncbi:MAG: type VI secretion system amidase immunity protein Tai4 [Alphaproteobacteria bacterium]|nr:type VI secretion system amidase immunity protein Tai4 [Alphaproteobacteria bacterium]
MKRLLIAFLLGACLSTPGVAEDAVPPTSRFSQTELLKNWALTVCLGSVVRDDADKRDAGVSATAYFQFSHVAVENFAELRKLALQYAGRKYSGSVPGDYNIMKCIDLFHSKELDGMARRLVRKTVP